MQCLSFSVWISSPSMVTCLAIYLCTSFIILVFRVEQYSIEPIFIVHSLADGYASCFHLLAIVPMDDQLITQWNIQCTDNMPSVAIDVSQARSTQNLLRTGTLISTVAAPLCTPTTSARLCLVSQFGFCTCDKTLAKINFGGRIRRGRRSRKNREGN